MSFLTKLFKRKPGGTFLGRLIRAVGDQFTFGLFSEINPMLPVAGNEHPSQSGGHSFE